MKVGQKGRIDIHWGCAVRSATCVAQSTDEETSFWKCDGCARTKDGRRIAVYGVLPPPPSAPPAPPASDRAGRGEARNRYVVGTKSMIGTHVGCAVTRATCVALSADEETSFWKCDGCDKTEARNVRLPPPPATAPTVAVPVERPYGPRKDASALGWAQAAPMRAHWWISVGLDDQTDVPRRGAPMIRPPIDQTWLDVARVLARRATCPRLAVGAVLVRDGVVAAHGWNGAPRGAVHCHDLADGCAPAGSCQRSVHAEMNAVCNAARAGQSALGATLYTTHAPCIGCANLIIQAGVARVVYGTEYKSTNGIDALRAGGVVVDKGEG